MEIEQFKYVLEDLKSQVQQIPSLQLLLKLTQKTTKKLQCINLYSQIDKRTFDLQIEQENIYTEMNQLYKAIISVKQQPPTEQQVQIISTRVDQIKQKYMQTFDILAKQQQILNQELSIIDKMLQNDEKKDQINQIKELDQYDDQAFQNDIQNKQMNGYNTQNFMESPQQRIQKLKKQIEEVQKKIVKINSGKGKWFDTDHKDFIKIYNKCAGNDKKIINQGIKILGMNQAQIMDHLQLYQNYLQLQKQKKIASQQFRQIKFFQEEQRKQVQEQKQQLKKLEDKVKKQKQLEERLRKKVEIQQYRMKKIQQKEKMIQKQEQQDKQKLSMKNPPLQPSKKKEIMQRNRIFIQNQQRKVQEANIRKQSIDNAKKVIQSRKKSTQDNANKDLKSQIRKEDAQKQKERGISSKKINLKIPLGKSSKIQK